MHYIRYVTLILNVFVFLTIGAQENAQDLLSKGHALYAEGKYSAAVGCYKKAADMNNAEAQFYMGYAYYAGEGIIKNYESAARWFHLSAAQKNPKAQYNLAFCYMEGKGVKRDYDEALRLLKASAEAGFQRAQVTLAECYANGVLVKKDSVKSERWKALANENKSTKMENNTPSEGAPRIVYGPTKMKKKANETKEKEQKKIKEKPKNKRKEVKPEEQIVIQLD